MNMKDMYININSTKYTSILILKTHTFILCKITSVEFAEFHIYDLFFNNIYRKVRI